MKKMSEVFKLPVSVDHYGLNDANNQTLIDGFDALEVHLKAAAHAINHVDALAEALDKLLSMLETEGRQDMEIFKECEKASNAYWGIK